MESGIYRNKKILKIKVGIVSGKNISVLISCELEGPDDGTKHSEVMGVVIPPQVSLKPIFFQ